MPTVLVVGGAGYVASLVLPLMQERFHFRIFDRNPPPLELTPTSYDSRRIFRFENWNPENEFVQGDVTDPAALEEAARGMDGLLYMAMGKGGASVNNPVPGYDVNVKGVHLALNAAVKAGIRRVVYTSSLSVYDGHLDIRSGASDSEEVHPEPRTIYGLTKWLGEEVCRYFHRTHSLPVLILRLFHPVSVEEWRARSSQAPDSQPNCCTAAPDLARALTAALELEHDGFEIIHVTGDTTGRAYRHEKARRILGWQPREWRVETRP